ncbi:MAG: hypothetical protein F9K23_12445 [Bacteroidetes bacterium]|nr:MAG: hypothetical protein F9K23_12445 [Bacteroidota bacterium]
MNKQSVFVIVVIAVLLGASCKKDKDENNNTVNVSEKTKLITGGGAKGWLFVSAKKDNVETLENCQKDNLYVYKTDKSLIVDEGATKCAANDPQAVAATWSFNAAEDSVSYNLAGSIEKYKIVVLTDKDMQLNTLDTVLGAGTVYTYTISFKAQ